MLSSLLAEIVDPYLPGPQRRLYRYQTYAEGRVMACRERCSLWQVYLHVFVMVILKIEFSLCVVFSREQRRFGDRAHCAHGHGSTNRDHQY
jgi:hypothetical protein